MTTDAGTGPPIDEVDNYTSDQLVDAVAAALRARDLPAVVALLRRLAAIDPARAERILDAIQLTDDLSSLGVTGE